MTRTLAILLSTMLVLGLAACGGDGGGDDRDDAPAQGAAVDDAQDTAAETEAAAPTVAVGQSSLGDILVDDEERTLYLFTSDSAGESTCEGECADNWPPLIVEGGPTAGEGVDAELLDTIERPDGAAQVVYGEWPLYLFAGDEAPGDVNGQDVNGVWFVLSPDGEAIRGPGGEGEDASEDAAPQSSGGAYGG